MIFSKFVHPLSRSSSRAKSVLSARAGGYGRWVVVGAPRAGGDYGGAINRELGFVRGYLTSIGAGKGSASKTYLSDLNAVLANPRVRRFFSSEAPKKKNYENFYPKERKEVPKGNENGNRQKSQSKGGFILNILSIFLYPVLVVFPCHC
uniref:Uncharacterized protein MANES_01G171200 n=1 Tax=Rhizophora mucronata TaxID=61149 RepID=A0A2P2LA61_RHIMU